MNSQKPKRGESDQATRPLVYRTWYFETCFRMIELFGSEAEKSIMQHMGSLESEETTELLQYYFSKKSFTSESLRVLKTILRLNRLTVDWETAYLSMIFNMNFIRFLHENAGVLDFFNFMAEQAKLNADSKTIALYGICMLLLRR